MWRKFEFHKSRKRITGCSIWRPMWFLITLLSIILRMRHISDKRHRENRNTHFILKNMFFFCFFFFFLENRDFYEITWKNFVQPGTTQITDPRLCAYYPWYLSLKTHPQNIKYLQIFFTLLPCIDMSSHNINQLVHSLYKIVYLYSEYMSWLMLWLTDLLCKNCCVKAFWR